MCLKVGGYTKSGHTRGLSRAQFAWIWRGVHWPSTLSILQKKWICDWMRCNFPLSWGAYLHFSVSS